MQAVWANANQPSGHTTPLIAAATGNQPEMVVFLLSQKADINARDSEGCTALFYAANNPKSEDANNATMPLVRILLKEGAKVDLHDNDSTTALMWAAGKGEAQVCEALLDAGAGINAVDKEGKSVLAHAVEGGEDDDPQEVRVPLDPIVPRVEDEPVPVREVPRVTERDERVVTEEAVEERVREQEDERACEHQERDAAAHLR
jgi:hypothetical protein